jgi:hypothetical protein
MGDTVSYLAIYTACIMIFGIITFIILIIMLNNENRFLLLKLSEGQEQVPYQQIIQEKTSNLWGAIGLQVLTLLLIGQYFNKQQ